MSNLTPAASWDDVVQLAGTMDGVPATWNTPNQALLNRTEWLKQNAAIYGPGGTVTQATSKSTAVTLNAKRGRVTMHNAAMAAGARVQFQMNNSQVGPYDTVSISVDGASSSYGYIITPYVGSGSIWFDVKNDSGSSLSQAVTFNFTVQPGATS